MEIPIFTLAAVALWLGSVPILLLVMLLIGVEATLLGPAKFGILPELSPPHLLLAANSWMIASSTVAILIGLIVGNLLILNAIGFWVVAFGGVAIAVSGWAVSLMIPGGMVPLTAKGWCWRGVLRDHLGGAAQLWRVRAVIVPIVGSSWFWFQGVISTTLFPLYVAQSPRQPETLVALLLLVSTLGVAAGALGARWLSWWPHGPALPVGIFLLIAIPGLDLWLVGPMHGPVSVARVLVDLFALSVGTGFYAVPLNTAIQSMTPPNERARFIGLNHTFNGLAMMGAGLAIFLGYGAQLSTAQILAFTWAATGLVAAVSIGLTRHMLRITSTSLAATQSS